MRFGMAAMPGNVPGTVVGTNRHTLGQERKHLQGSHSRCSVCFPQAKPAWLRFPETLHASRFSSACPENCILSKARNYLQRQVDFCDRWFRRESEDVTSSISSRGERDEEGDTHRSQPVADAALMEECALEELRDQGESLKESEETSSTIDEGIFQVLLLLAGVGAALTATCGYSRWTEKYEEERRTGMLVGAVVWVTFAAATLGMGLASLIRPMLLKHPASRRMAQFALFFGPVVFVLTNSVMDASILVVFSFFAVLLQATTVDKRQSSSSLASLSVAVLFYVGFVIAADMPVDSVDSVRPEGTLELLKLRGFALVQCGLLPTTFVVTAVLLIRRLAQQLESTTRTLDAVERELILERSVLHALVPEAVAVRLLNMEENTIIADSFPHSAVLFVYICEQDGLMERFGVDRTIEWINQVFHQFDSVVTPRQGARTGMTKIETFSQIYLLVAWGVDPPPTHLRFPLFAPAQQPAQQPYAPCRYFSPRGANDRAERRTETSKWTDRLNQI